MDEMLMRFINTVTNNIDITDSLNEKINLINENVKHNINLTWAILGVAIGIAGLALYTLSKSWVNKSVEKELDTIKINMKNELSNELENKLKIHLNDKVDSEFKQIKEEVYQLKGGLDERVIDLIDNRSKIRWSSGSTLVLGNGQVHIGVFQGLVDWNSPITYIRLVNELDGSEIPFDIIQKGDQEAVLKIKKDISTDNLKYTIVWYDKSK